MTEAEVTATPVSGKKIVYDSSLSLNTIIVCLTIATVSWGLIDKIGASAATTATMQQAIKTNELVVKELNTQRFIDRQELLSELREIRKELQQIRLAGK